MEPLYQRLHEFGEAIPGAGVVHVQSLLFGRRSRLRIYVEGQGLLNACDVVALVSIH